MLKLPQEPEIRELIDLPRLVEVGQNKHCLPSVFDAPKPNSPDVQAIYQYALGLEGNLLLVQTSRYGSTILWDFEG